MAYPPPNRVYPSPLLIDDEEDEDVYIHWRHEEDDRMCGGGQVNKCEWEMNEREGSRVLSCWMVNNFMSVVGDTDLDDESLVAQEPARRARMGWHPQQRPMFQFGKYRNEAHEDATEKSPY